MIYKTATGRVVTKEEYEEIEKVGTTIRNKMEEIRLRQENPSSVFSSNGFWIVVAVFFLIWLFNDISKNDNHSLTPSDMKNAISECRNWGGEVIYGSDGNYQNCAINGRIE